MNQSVDNIHQHSLMHDLSNMLLSPLASPVSYLSAIRGFLIEMPKHQSRYATEFFESGEFELLGPKWLRTEDRFESSPSIVRSHYFIQRDIRHLALSADGLVMVREFENSSTKGDRPQSHFEILGHPTPRDVINLARITTYETVKQLATSVIEDRKHSRENPISGQANF